MFVLGKILLVFICISIYVARVYREGIVREVIELALERDLLGRK
jgi:hypothetical protein